jgi:hypothetical protein
VKQRQQRELADSIVARIERELQNPKVLKQILEQAVVDVESEFVRLLPWVSYSNVCRNRCQEGLIVGVV